MILFRILSLSAALIAVYYSIQMGACLAGWSLLAISGICLGIWWLLVLAELRS